MAAVTADTADPSPGHRAAPGDSSARCWPSPPRPAGLEGEGFPVRRTMAGINYAYLDPFIMMDHMGEVDYAAGEPKGTNWHPHRGFETVTYLIEGQFIHQDTHGGGGVITEGATQWMTAGAGLLHIETPPEQLVEDGRAVPRLPALGEPAGQGQVPDAPSTRASTSGQITLLASADGGSLLRVIAGEVDGHAGPGFDPHPDHAAPCLGRAGQRSCRCPGSRTTTRWPT